MIDKVSQVFTPIRRKEGRKVIRVNVRFVFERVERDDEKKFHGLRDRNGEMMWF